MKENWDKIEGETEIYILKSAISRGKLVNVMYCLTLYLAVVMFLVIPLRPLILDVILPLNETRPKEPVILAEFFVDEDKYFRILVTHAFITGACGVLPIVGSDTFYFACVQHACGMMKILGFCENINEAYSTSFMLILFICMMLMSITGVATIIKFTGVEQLNDVVRFIMFTNAQVFHLFCYNYMGQEVLNCVEELRMRM
ncbi:hypothetical protein QAD02_015965 [Eretmocerus hayati]|uniref:Uncharacterized protein n=1 Tax=Eretmocerus hayati TaxID=131215 RepID=A0ACC2PAR3_9HYME|nr:hypothetical protein QAD02_015965 [Eretmocerus hayati]